MAEYNARLVEGRKIPRSWFTATHRASTMAVLERGMAQERVAALGEGERALGWFVLPPFQRAPVWNRSQQARFVESCWLGLPIGIIIYNRPEGFSHPFENWLLDGQQRITALYAYMADEFPVFGALFSELTVIDRRYWDMGTALPMAETSITDEAQLRDVYDRLAYGGTAHEPRPA